MATLAFSGDTFVIAFDNAPFSTFNMYLVQRDYSDAGRDIIVRVKEALREALNAQNIVPNEGDLQLASPILFFQCFNSKEEALKALDYPEEIDEFAPGIYYIEW